jgi:predicted 3-demethylubiquinone-9 3-methyltransferase (glyoxalase superfamily)
MAIAKQKITPCLWFDSEAEEAANFYVSVFDNSRIGRISRYTKNWDERINGKKPGSVLTVEFELEGQTFVALNGGPHFTFSEAISLQVRCETQEEIDYFWSRLSEGGEEGPCGWLKDRFGLSWQVAPTVLPEMLTDPDADKAQRVTTAYLQMKKFDIAALERAYAGAQ